MNTNQPDFYKKIHHHLDNKIKFIHRKYKGQHKFLNNILFSPGNERYGFFDKSHTYKTIATLEKALEIDDFRFFLTDIEFDMSLLYLFDIETNEGDSIHSAAFNTNKSTLSLIRPRYMID